MCSGPLEDVASLHQLRLEILLLELCLLNISTTDKISDLLGKFHTLFKTISNLSFSGHCWGRWGPLPSEQTGNIFEWARAHFSDSNVLASSLPRPSEPQALANALPDPRGKTTLKNSADAQHLAEKELTFFQGPLLDLTRKCF